MIDRPGRIPDWQDCHAGPVAGFDTARACYEAAFQRLPRWVAYALAARNALMRPFGLVTEGPKGAPLMLSLPVVEDSPAAYEIGTADKHLTFTLRTELDGAQARLTTSIWFNHWAGRLYLAAVLIPHKIIVRQALRGVA